MRSKRRRLWQWWVGLIALTGALVTPAPAAADPFPGNADTTLADSATHIYCLTSTFTTDPEGAHYAMIDVLEGTTGMDSLYRGSCTDSSVDVWWWERNLPAGIRGERQCIVYTSASVCNSSDVRMDYDEIDIGTSDAEDRRKTAVHEIGHTLGFGHFTQSDAMRQGEIPDTNVRWRRYCDHHEDHLDSYAPGGTDFFECTF